MAVSVGKSISQWLSINIPPLYGLPKEVNVDYPSQVPSNMWLIRLNERGRQIEKLRIQCVPLEINVNSESNWAIVPSIGRNNPFYHYTGGEDILQFTLDWYSVDNKQQDVIDKCRIIESWSKADGYVNSPPTIVLVYGDLYVREKWIITSAPYRLSLFNKELGMMPRQAYQELTLKRITDHNLRMLERQGPTFINPDSYQSF